MSGGAAHPTSYGTMMQLYTRRANVAEREVDDAVFLVTSESETVFHLNATGGVVWRLLAEPTSIQQVVAVLHEAFPDVARERIETDVATVIDGLVDQGFVTCCD